MILALRRYVCDVKRPVGPHARDLALVVFRAPCVERTRRVDHAKFNFYAESRTSVARLDLISDAHAPAAPVAVVAFPFIVARALLGFYVLFEDAGLFLAVVICVWIKL